MTRVAAVASVLFDARKAIDTELSGKEELISACLLHDMANLLKTRKETPVQFFEPEGEEYWMQKYNEMVKRYGKDVDRATILIAQEIGASKKTQEIIASIGFTALDEGSSLDILCMIANYADMRVPPEGIGTLAERISDGRKRYKDIAGALSEEFIRRAYEQECEIFEGLYITPSDITEERIDGIRKELFLYKVV